MPKRIQETITRWCCEPVDLKPLKGATLNYKRAYDIVICKHCHQEYEFYMFTDAAGSTDWSYREVSSVKHRRP